MARYTKQQILKNAEEENVRYIRLMFTDINGTIKSVEIPVGRLKSALEGQIMFDGSSIEGFARLMEADMYLKPDFNTWLIQTWEKSAYGKVGRLICDAYTTEHEPSPVDPRVNLKRIIKKMEDMGFANLNIGFEPEFFLFKMDENGKITNEVTDNGGYFDLSPIDDAGECRRDIVLALEQIGFTMEASHHEVAPGQNEINFQFSNVLEACDNIQTFKLVAKNVARRHGLHASFMPKPIAGINGSGMHAHCSIDDRDGHNVFSDPDDPKGLSVTCRQWLTGLITHARGFCALTNPTVNSYKRLVPGYEAPCYVSWSEKNRSVMIRIPMTRGEKTRTEIRNIDTSANPYLAMAAVLSAGLDGIEHDLPKVDSVDANLFEKTAEERKALGVENLPTNLKEAVIAMTEDPLMKEALGDHIYGKFIDLKMLEWQDFSKFVTNWEIERYKRLI